MSVLCPYCDREAKLVSGVTVYPSRADLRDRLFWRCAPCDAHVGTHADSTHRHVPLGSLANAELREWRRRAHTLFDPLWQQGNNPLTRAQAYEWLRKFMGLTRHEAHIGAFGLAQCQRLVAAIEEGRPLEAAA